MHSSPLLACEGTVAIRGPLLSTLNVKLQLEIELKQTVTFSRQFKNTSLKESSESLSIVELQLHLQIDQQIISLNSLCCIFK